MTDQELVSRARRGDQDAFEQLVLDNQNRVYTLCLRMAGDPEDALDLAQETFLNAWRGLPSFRGGNSFSTWLYRLAVNVCIDFLRSRGRRQEVEFHRSPDDAEAGVPEPEDPGPTPEEALERRELRRAVERGLQALPDRQREILVMRELSGLSYQEIGQILDLDLGTVKSRIARARLALKKRLLEDGNFSGLPPFNQTEPHGKGR